MIDPVRFTNAVALASSLHQDQTRKGSQVPYLSHLLAVSAIVMRFGGDEDECIAALLHDAVEDQGGQPTLVLIEQLFGPRVAEIVVGCSDTDELPKPPWLERKTAYLEHLKQASASVLLVSAADKLHNAQDMLISYSARGEAVWKLFKGSKDQTLWYHRSLAEIFEARSNEHPSLVPLFSEYIKVIEQLNQL